MIGDVRYEGDKYIAFTKWWRSKVNDTYTLGEHLFAEPTTINKVMLSEDRDIAIQSADDESRLPIKIPKVVSHRQTDMSIVCLLTEEEISL